MARRVFIRSSELRWVSFDPAARTLTVEFVSGGIYRYREVSAYKYKALLAASSRGRYFNSHIRDKHPFDHLA